MVNQEKHTRGTNGWHQAVDDFSLTANISQVVRAANGGWHIFVEIDAVVVLHDGRKILTGKREIQVRAVQNGSRPRTSNLPNSKKKATKKAKGK